MGVGNDLHRSIRERLDGILFQLLAITDARVAD